MNAKKALLAGSILSAFLWAGTVSASPNLSPPFDVAAIRTKAGKPDKDSFKCKSPPAPLRDLKIESFYEKGDKSFSIVDKIAHAVYKKATKPASLFEIGVANTANRYVRSSPPRPEIAACTLDWLAEWAEAGALLGNVNKNGEYTRKWLLGSISSAWMQIRDEPSLDPAKRTEVINWIRKVAEVAKADFSRDTDLKSRQNNHLYWAAWGVGAAGMAIDDTRLFDWAVAQARTGIDDIEEDGTLPLELARGKRAYHYHLFSAMPLFMLANAAEKNGIDLFKQNGEALRRLGDLCIKNLGHAKDFEEMTGKEQDISHAGTISDLGWVEIYHQHYRDPRAEAILQKFNPMKQSRFGGNISLLYGKSPKKSSRQG